MFGGLLAIRGWADANELAPGQAGAGTPGWSVAFGSEFWRLSATASATSRLTSPSAASAGISDALERVTHAFTPSPQRSAAFAKGDHYLATVTAEGFRFIPAMPAGDARAGDSPGEKSPIPCEARFRSVAAKWGGREWSAGSGQSPEWVVGNTRQRLLDAEYGLVEHLEARRDGMEVTWVLKKKPAGEEDLSIEAELAGLRFSSQTSSGLHFEDESGIARVRVSPVTAVDHQGRRWPIATAMTGGHMRIEVPAEILKQARFPLAIDPLVSAEFGLDEPVTGPTPCTRAAPAVAVNYSGYLMAWTHGKGETTDPAVYAARVDPLGNLLDPLGILVSGSAGEQTTCKVAALPDGFLVTWSAPHGTSVSDWDILAARVQWDGTVLDATPLPVCTVAGTVQNCPAVAAGAGNYLVTWADARSTGIYGAIVAPDGRISPTNGFAISTAAYEQFTPAVAALGTNFLVVWQDYRHSTASVYTSDIYGARVTAGGGVLDPAGIPICRRPNSQYQPAVAANAGQYLVLWEDYDPGGNDIFGARVGVDGLVMDTNALQIAHAANAQCNPALTANFSDFLVVWQDYRGSSGTNYVSTTYVTRVRADGSVAYPEALPASSSQAEQLSPAVAGVWDDFLVVWQDARNNPDTTLSDICGAGVESGRELAVEADGQLSFSANAELAPKVACAGTTLLVVWADNRNAAAGGWDILGVRLDAQGGLLDSSAIAICTVTNHQTEPAVAAQGTNFLVVWSDLRNALASAPYSDIYGAVVGLSGTVSPPGGFAVCLATNDQNRPAVTPLGTGYLAVWQDARHSPPNLVRSQIFGARMTPAGQVLDPAGLPICTNTFNQSTPAAAGNARQALVVWAELRSTANTDIYGARVAEDGALPDTNAFPLCALSGAQSVPAVATDGAGYLVAWTDPRPSATGADIYGARVGSDGIVSPPNGFAIRVASGQQSAPAVVFNGLDYLAAWQEARSSASNSFDIFAVGITPQGALFPPAPLPVNTNLSNQLTPAIAAGPDARFLVVNQGFQYSARRAVANFVNLEAIPRLDSARVAGGGEFQYRLRCAPGENYALEASEDLVNWVSLGNLAATNHSMWVADPATSAFPHRFYRAFLLP